MFLSQFPIADDRGAMQCFADLRVCLWGDTAASELPYIGENLGGEMLRGVFGCALSARYRSCLDFHGYGGGYVDGTYAARKEGYLSC